MGPGASDIHADVARLARNDASRVLATLARALGPAYFQLAEDAVQHALLQALRLWPHAGRPRNPAAWIFAVARNHLRDQLRAMRRLAPFDEALNALPAPAPSAEEEARFARELSDDELALLFATCHPALSPESRVALALNCVCGLSARQIAAGLLASEASVAKRITRAKRTLAELDLEIAAPSPDDFQERLEAVRTVIFLLFNEGYSASSGEALCAPELCWEAARLAVALARHPATASPESDALSALLLLTLARVPSRIAADGVALLLDQQDRGLWDRKLVAEGVQLLARSARGATASVWHLRAEIAALHAIAPSLAETNWPALADAYERLCAIDASPIVWLGRAVVIGKTKGPGDGLIALREPLRKLPGSGYVQAAAGRFLLDLGKPKQAALRFARARTYARTEPERRLMERHLKDAEAATKRGDRLQAARGAD
ncbi:RNA polymerase sigma factor [Phenylobacterium terrae]|uniref:RNA polymerase sigma factor n=1 Tax=Phenylobacterium terrae TaxID=2665495 RepID=A0ABW4N639_9CAUL